MKRPLKISVETGNVFDRDVDVLVLKYAQNLYGADKEAHNLLTKAGIRLTMPLVGDFLLKNTKQAMGPKHVLFVGVAALIKFRYQQIREFSRDALRYLSDTPLNVQSLAMTIHGAGYGLDEVETFESEVAGAIDAISSTNAPSKLKKLIFVERDSRRAERLRQSLRSLFPSGVIVRDNGDSAAGLEERTQSTLRTAGYAASGKSHVFVAMPFAPDMDDVFHYGIQGAVNAAGRLCERADLSSFTGDIVDWVKNRISTASLVIADLSTANPNVYLEVGYAWGCEVPTVLLTRDASDLKFDTRGQRCILYKSIKNLEDLLQKELQNLLR